MADRRPIKYEDVAKGLEDLFAVAATLGLEGRPQRGRFGEYQRRLATLIEIAAIRQAGRPLPGALASEINTHLLAYRVALTEALEARGIASVLRDSTPAVAAEKLGIILSGPPLPSDEDPASNRARNIQFEITVADLLRRGGYRPVLGEHPDLRVHVVDRDYLIECKRVFSPAKIGDRIDQAGKQLHRDRKNVTAAARAIIAISLSRVLNPDDRTFLITNTDAGRKGLVAWLEEARRIVGSRYHALFAKDFVVGAFLHASSTFENLDTGTFDHGTQWTAEAYIPPLASYAKSLRALGRSLTALEY